MRPLLNSERIQACFGSYGVEVLCQDGGLRVSNLFSIEPGGTRSTRTLAVVRFAETIPPQLEDAYQQIQAGSSLGSTLQRAGWFVSKELEWLAEAEIPSELRAMTRDQVEIAGWGDWIAVSSYRLSASKAGEQYWFATITELYDPRYLDLGDLELLSDAGKVAADPAHSISGHAPPRESITDPAFSAALECLSGRKH